jgi:hypothetical protein
MTDFIESEKIMKENAVEPTLTVKAIADAIRKDGKPQTTGYYWKPVDDEEVWTLTDRFDEEGIIPTWNEVGAACAVGMASLILNISPNLIEDTLYPLAFDEHLKLREGRTFITRLNDDEKLTFEQIADKLEEWAREDGVL